MHIRADFGEPAIVHPGDEGFRPSPVAGVERILLDRIGDEVARATSIVRYAPGSRFSPHVHGGGEEFLVLEGVFSDEAGHYPAGTYVRNPIGSRHAPYSEGGCTIFVKLRQFSAEDQRAFSVDTRATPFEPTPMPGLERLALHQFGNERVEMLRLAPGVTGVPALGGGVEEILVLDGVLEDEEGAHPAGSWLRRPDGASLPLASREGCLLWRKAGAC